MPIYEYQCEACGHKLEKLQKISDEPLRDCPSCKASKLTKLVSAAAFRLKGAGWYETDFKTGKKKNVSQGEKSGSSDSSSDSSSSSSSKDSKSKSNSGASSATNN
ncbi:MAG TPA: hypothetical protein DCM54_06250 [Gammaproteobacteria bacterium]|nr:hypothetical protein [Gammaproteobacteria bacterium]|tara:strand:+ start:130 stop:444 length:315 start_codon:yes stop_codon:yes gene_type:complete